jgi:hypothetical protein
MPMARCLIRLLATASLMLALGAPQSAANTIKVDSGGPSAGEAHWTCDGLVLEVDGVSPMTVLQETGRLPGDSPDNQSVIVGASLAPTGLMPIDAAPGNLDPVEIMTSGGVVVVSEPGSMVLVGSGLFLFARIIRSRKWTRRASPRIVAGSGLGARRPGSVD